MKGGFDGVSADVLELRADLLVEVEVFLRVIKVFLEVVIAKLVSVFILAVLLAVDLNGIVGEMNELVVRIT